MKNILKDNTKLNFQVNHEKCVNEILKKLKSAGSLSDKQRKTIKEVGSRPGVLYSPCKIHKAIVDVCPSFRPKLFPIQTPLFKTA